MLAFHRDNPNTKKLLITADFKKDLSWFNQFLSTYNGIVFYDQPPASNLVALDACLTGLGDTLAT